MQVKLVNILTYVPILHHINYKRRHISASGATPTNITSHFPAEKNETPYLFTQPLTVV